MTVPPYIITPGFTELLNVNDVQEIMDAMDTTIKAAAFGWTEPSADRFKSPPDASGRFVEVLMTRFNATTLRFQVIDDQGRSPATDFEFTLTPTSTVTLFYGAPYLYIVQYGTTQHFFMTLLTLAPEIETAHTSYTLCGADDLLGGVAATVTTTRMYLIGSGGTFLNASGICMNFGTRSGDGMDVTRHISGANRAAPFYNVADDGVLNNIRGRMFNVVILHIDATPPGAERVIPLGDGTSGIFKAHNMPDADDVQILVRKS